MGLNIEIKGVEFQNKGAALMLQAIIQQLDKHIKDYQLVLNTGPLSPPAKRKQLGALQKLSMRRMGYDFTVLFSKLPKFLRSLLARFGIITEKDIDVILDASGFAYGDQWSVHRLERAANEASRFKQQNKAYILLPQALGPFSSTQSRTLAAKLITNSTLIYPRDPASRDNCMQVCERGDMRVSPDFTVAVQGTLPVNFDTNVHQFCIIPNSKMISDKNPEQQWKACYVEMLIEMASWATDHGYSAFILNHEGEKDRKIAQQIAVSQKTPLPIIDIDDPIMIKGIIGQSRFVLSSRYHGCVSALTQGVITLGTSWSHKYQALFADFGCTDNLISANESHQQWCKRLDELVSCDSKSKELEDSTKYYRQKTEQMWQEVFYQIGKLTEQADQTA